MFEQNQPPQQPQQPMQPQSVAPQQTGNLGLGQSPSSPSPSAGEQSRVYTMPEKFMPPKSGKGGSGGGKKIAFIIALVVAVIIIVVAAVVYALQLTTKQEEPTPTSNVNTANTTPAANENMNENANEESNTNLGTLLNTNVNEDLGENINEGLFPNDNQNANANANTNAAVPFPDRSDVTSARDKDKDKLTDEEEALYGTKFELPDTDHDGFVDGTEVLNGFSPSDKDETLLNTGQVIQYDNKQFGWVMNYPAKWFAEPLDETNREIVFTSDSVDGELVEVIISDNPKGQTAAQWFAALYEDIEPGDLEAVTLGSLKGIVSPDGFTYYFADSNYIIGILYNFGTKDEVHFQTTFQMMVDSFAYTPKKKTSTTNTNTNTNNNSNTNTQ
ncbi:MAG: hypothetical protein ABIG66_05465 [Candidatus Kerfeldbacteria bacterium]